MGQVSVNAGEFTTAVVFKRPERDRTETGAVRKTYVEAGKALVIAPKSTQGFSRMERDTRKILALWQDGYFAGRDAAGAVRQLWTSDSSV